MPTDPLHGARVLVADGDRAVASFLADNLAADGCKVLTAGDLPFALAVLQGGGVDAVIVDLNGSTFDAVDTIRGSGLVARVNPDVPVMVLTSRYDDQVHRQRAYERGADDVIAKPFSYPELRARLSRLLRRPPSPPARDALSVGGLTIDTAPREVRVDGTLIDVSAREYALLVMLAREPNRVFTKDELLHAVWGHRGSGHTRTLDSHACRLRHKLGVNGGRYVVNVWGVGYRLTDATREAVAA